MNIATVASMTNAEYQILIVSMVKGETLMSGQDRAIHDLSAELLPKSVLISYSQSGKCNERQASNYADSSVFIRSTNQALS